MTTADHQPHGHHHHGHDGRDHGHRHAGHAIALQPTLSLLRLSVAQRLAGAAVLIAALWAAVAGVIG
jgi:hypothetical protein